MHILALLTLVQMPWTSHLPEHGLALDFLRPKFVGGGTSLTSVAGYASARIATGDGYFVHLELPFAHLGEAGSSSSAVGNPYVGFGRATPTLSVEFGLRPAITPNDEVAPQVGFYSDVTRREAFNSELATVSGRVSYRRHLSSKLALDLGGGPTLWIRPVRGETDVTVLHFASLRYAGRTVWSAVGFGGLLILTSNEAGTAERTFEEFGASAGVAQGRIRPALHVIVPLDKSIRDDLNVVIGVGAALSLK